MTTFSKLKWRRRRPFDLEILDPSILGSAAPTAQELVRFNERQYAAICALLHQATTREALRHRPRDTSTPAIALDPSGAHDLVAPDRGLMIPAAAAASLPGRLATGIGDLLADPARRDRMGAAARQWAGNYPFDHSAARLASLLQEA